MMTSAGSLGARPLFRGREPTPAAELLDASMSRTLLALIEDSPKPGSAEGCRRGVHSAVAPLPATGRLVRRWGRQTAGVTQRFHTGVDLEAPPGTEVFAVRPGRVVALIHRGNDEVLGNQGSAAAVMIRHDDDCWTVYANLTEVLVRKGDHVEAGRTLGVIGDWRQLEPGSSAHLHFEVLERRGTGAVPLFGPIERCYCRDPEAWLRRHGVEYNGCGRLIRRA